MKWAAVFLVFAVVLVAGAAAHGAYPGRNGLIAITLYQDSKPFVATIEPDGTNLKMLREGISPAWSPDGRSIAYTASGIWVMNADGSEPRLVAKDGGDPTWSPDGTRLAYAGPNYDLYIVGATGGAPRRLTSGGGADHSPAWSPDGDLIAYIYEEQQADGFHYDLWTIRPDGSDARRIAEIASNPSWSPDGSRLLYDRGFRGKGTIFTVPRSGGTPKPLRLGFFASLSPDGRRLLLNGSHGGVCIANSDGTDARELSYAGLPGDWQPAAAAAPGTRLAYSCDNPISHLDLTVRASPKVAPVGGRVVFTVTLVNRGPDPITPTLRIRIPSTGTSLAPKRGVPRCGVAPYFGCSTPRLYPGDRFERRFPIRADEPGRLRLGVELWAEDRKGLPAAEGATLVPGCTILGTGGRDTIVGTPQRDVICGDAGGDTIRGGGGNDLIYGADGADRIYGDAGVDTVSAGFGNDYVEGGDGNDRLFAGLGDDDLFGGPGADALRSAQPNPRVIEPYGGDNERDRMHGGPGDDTIEAGEHNDRYFGEGGDDLLLAQDGWVDYLTCGRGRDRAFTDARDRTNTDCEFNQPEP